MNNFERLLENLNEVFGQWEIGGGTGFQNAFFDIELDDEGSEFGVQLTRLPMVFTGDDGDSVIDQKRTTWLVQSSNTVIRKEPRKFLGIKFGTNKFIASGAGAIPDEVFKTFVKAKKHIESHPEAKKFGIKVPNSLEKDLAREIFDPRDQTWRNSNIAAKKWKEAK